MTTAKKDDLIAHDPLAWMDEEQQSSSQEPVDKDAEIPSPAHGLQDPEQDSSMEPHGSDEPVLLPATLNIQGVAQLHEQLQGLLHNRSMISIDASNVESIDTAALQLLVIFRQEALKSGLEVSITAPSSRFVKAARLLDVADLLEVD